MTQIQDFINQCDKNLWSMEKMNILLVKHKKKKQKSFTEMKVSCRHIQRHIQRLLHDSKADVRHYKAKVAKLEKKLESCQIMCCELCS